MQVVPDWAPPSDGNGTNGRKEKISVDNNTNTLRNIEFKKPLSTLEVEDLLVPETMLVPSSRNSGERDVKDDSDDQDHQPPTKITKQTHISQLMATPVKVMKVEEEASVLTIGTLQGLHQIYLANKAKREAMGSLQRNQERSNYDR